MRFINAHYILPKMFKKHIFQTKGNTLYSVLCIAIFKTINGQNDMFRLPSRLKASFARVTFAFFQTL